MKEVSRVSKRLKVTSAVMAFGLVAALASTMPANAAAKKVNWKTVESVADAGGLDALVAQAQKEGELNLIATPRDWANYGEAIDTFAKAFNIKVNSDNPDGSSAEEIVAIKTTKNMAKMPDVVDIGMSVLDDAAGLLAPYKVANWKDIPNAVKDPDGTWYGAYAGKMALWYDTSVSPAPTKITDLDNAAYKGMVALPGDPTSAQQALIAVIATSIANGGSAANVSKGLDFFKKLKANGNYTPVKGNASNFATGSFKISLGWDYNAIGYTAAAKQIGKTIKYVYPSDAHVQGTPYVLAINKTAPHPAAARLWEEFMFSQVKGKISKDLGANDYKKIKGAKMMAQIMGGQNSYIIGGAHPTTEPAMQAKGLAVASPAGIPVPANWPKMVVPSVDYQNAASEVLKAAWPNL